MKTKVSPAIVGAFVIGAFALGIVALLTFGGVNFFQKPQRFVVYFDESIQGLDLGSPVKLRGVRVGRVVDLNIRYDRKTNHSAVAVVCELTRNKLADVTGTEIDATKRAELQQLVDHGLRAQLGFLGLATGLLFVELDFMDPAQYPLPPPNADVKYVTIPAVPSQLSEFQARATDLLAKVNRIDFEGITVELKKLMVETRTRLEGVDFKGVAEQWKKTGAQLETLAASADVKRTFDNLNGAIADLRATLAKVDAQVEPAGKELKDALAEVQRTVGTFNETAVVARRFIAANASVGDELGETMEHLNEAADAVKRLADFLERNPNALITGKKRPQ
ncbi:MAG TPA: MlaD family protein [Opitutaceae bacterium]|nr:MlaD family protein [Opitutaceae bacterium]